MLCHIAVGCCSGCKLRNKSSQFHFSSITLTLTEFSREKSALVSFNSKENTLDFSVCVFFCFVFLQKIVVPFQSIPC